MDQDEQRATSGVPQRLLTCLDRLLRARVAVVSAPAGHGKSALVRSWLAAHPEIEAHWLQQPAELVRWTAAPTGQGLRVLVLAREELLLDPVLAADALDLAERQPGLRLVFVGRRRPDAPLGSLAARGLLVDLDAGQLGWTREEVAGQLAPTNPGLTPEVLDDVMARTRGWPAMVRMLATEPLTWAHASKVARLADSYIASEVLAGLDGDDLRLLQELSVLPGLDPLAAAWMTGRGDAAAQLSRLQAQGIPITWDDANTIQLNPVLRDHLARRLAQEQPERCRELHERAALWLRNRGRTTQAVRLAMQAGLADLAWMLAAEFLTVHQYGADLADELPRLVELLPPGWELDVVRSVARGLATPHSMLAQVQAVGSRLAQERGDTGRFGHVALALGMARRAGYPADHDVSAAVAVAQSIDGAGVHELDLALLSSARTEYGLWLMHQGRMREAQEVLLAALGTARVVDVPWAVVTTLSALALIHAEQGQVDTANRLAGEALLTCSETVFTTDALDENALLALATTAIDTGDLPAARRWLERLDRHQDPLAENDALRTHVQATYHVVSDDPATARRVVEAYRDQPRRASTPLHEYVVGRACVDACLVEGDVAAAQLEFDRLLQCPPTDMSDGLVVLQARLALARGDAEAAHELLRERSRPGAPPFHQARCTLYMLMIFGVAADALHRTEESRHAFQRAAVLAGRMGLDTPAARHTRMAAASRHEVPLTEAERQVLQRLDPGRTLAQTAEELFISPNTLKTHLRRIYRKLGVANREEAIERAQVLGLRSGPRPSVRA